MMMFGLLLSVLGLALAYQYSAVLGAILFLVGAALLARGYLRTDPPEPPPRTQDSGGSITYNIPSSKRK